MMAARTAAFSLMCTPETLELQAEPVTLFNQRLVRAPDHNPRTYPNNYFNTKQVL